MTRTSKRILWFVANVLMVGVIIAIACVTLLPAIWGPNDNAESEFGRRARPAKEARQK